MERERLDQEVREVLCAQFPDLQAVYLYGSYARGDAWPQSDVDVAVLLLPTVAKNLGPDALISAQMDLVERLGKEVDLVNLRQVSTVMQKEVVMAEARICTADAYAAEEFEMLVLSFYQQLNEERAAILEEGLRTGRFYKP